MARIDTLREEAAKARTFADRSSSYWDDRAARVAAEENAVAAEHEYYAVLLEERNREGVAE